MSHVSSIFIVFPSTGFFLPLIKHELFQRKKGREKRGRDHLPVMGSQSLPPLVPPNVPPPLRTVTAAISYPPAGHGHSWVGRAARLGHCKALSTPSWQHWGLFSGQLFRINPLPPPDPIASCTLVQRPQYFGGHNP